jgi:hypothetical protein
VASSLLLYEDLVGPTLRSGHLGQVSAYYVEGSPGSPAPAPTAKSPGGSSPEPAGPAIALPADAELAVDAAQPPGRITVTIPYRKLLEVTHFHLFTVPVFLLILTHLFMLTALSARSKLLWITLGWLTGTLHILAPWLVRYGGPRLASLFPLSGTGLLVSSLVLCVYPLAVMWRRPARGQRRAGPGADAVDENPSLTD